MINQNKLCFRRRLRTGGKGGNCFTSMFRFIASRHSGVDSARKRGGGGGERREKRVS
jgi:hypothetical protein